MSARGLACSDIDLAILKLRSGSSWSLETLQMFRKMKRIVPDYPVSLAFADIGHGWGAGYDHNPDHAASIKTLSDRFLDTWLLGNGNGVPRGAVSLRTECRDVGRFV